MSIIAGVKFVLNFRTLLRFETRASPTRLGSKIGAKFRNFYLLKIRGGMGKISESFFKFSLGSYILGGLIHGLEV